MAVRLVAGESPTSSSSLAAFAAWILSVDPSRRDEVGRLARAYRCAHGTYAGAELVAGLREWQAERRAALRSCVLCGGALPLSDASLSLHSGSVAVWCRVCRLVFELAADG